MHGATFDGQARRLTIRPDLHFGGSSGNRDIRFAVTHPAEREVPLPER